MVLSKQQVRFKIYRHMNQVCNLVEVQFMDTQPQMAFWDHMCTQQSRLVPCVWCVQQQKSVAWREKEEVERMTSCLFGKHRNLVRPFDLLTLISAPQTDYFVCFLKPRDSKHMLHHRWPAARWPSQWVSMFRGPPSKCKTRHRLN